MAPRNSQDFKTGDIVRLADWITKEDDLVLSDGWGPFLVTCKDGEITRLHRTDGQPLQHRYNADWNQQAFRRDEFLTAVHRAKKKAAAK